MGEKQGDRYTHGHEASTLASHGTRTAQNSCAYLLPHLEPGLSILDVGCGPGTITLDLASVVDPGPVVGIERVDPPLTTAREAAEARGDARTRFQVADAYSLPFPDGSFDVVHAHQVLQHLTDPVAVLREMTRVCRPGGLLAVRDADYAAMAWYPEEAGMDDWREAYRAMARRNGAEPDAGRRLRRWAREADLADPQVTTSVWTYADPESCTWWSTSQAERVRGEVFVRQAAELGFSRADVDRMADAWLAWGSSADAWFVIVHGELLVRV